MNIYVSLLQQVHKVYVVSGVVIYSYNLYSSYIVSFSTMCTQILLFCTQYFQLLPSLPLSTVSSVIDNSAIQVDEDSDVISWEPPTDPGGEILFYQILVTRDGENVRTAETTQNSLDVSDLDPDAGRYEVQV